MTLPLFPAEVNPAALTAVIGLAWASVPAAAPVIGRPMEEGIPILPPRAAVPILAPPPRAGAPFEAVCNENIHNSTSEAGGSYNIWAVTWQNQQNDVCTAKTQITHCLSRPVGPKT